MSGKDVLLSVEHTAILVVDVQEKLFPYINEKFKVLDNITKLLKFAKITGIPVILTEQNPKGLGRTIREIKDLIPDVEPIEKYTFSCAGEDSFIPALKNKNLQNLIVVGIETHICITQTVIDLLKSEFCVHVVSDAVGSRGKLNHDTGISRMGRAGAVISTVEMVMYEYLKTSEHPNFKDFLREVMK